MKYFTLVSFAAAVLLAAGCSKAPKDGVFQAPRTIVTCDPELDDNNSMIRFLLQAQDGGDPVLTRYLRTIITVK
jgi:hypothetical protein